MLDPWGSRAAGHLVKSLVAVTAFLVFYFTIFSPVIEWLKHSIAPFAIEEKEVLPPQPELGPLPTVGPLEGEGKEAALEVLTPLEGTEKIVSVAEPVPLKKPPAGRKPKSTKARASFKRKKVVQPEEIRSSSGKKKGILGIEISKNEEKKFIKKPFCDTSLIAMKKGRKKDDPLVDAYELRESLYAPGAGQKTMPVEKMVFLVKNLRKARNDIFTLSKGSNGEIVDYKNGIISLYIPTRRYPGFIEKLEEEIGELVRPAPGAFVDVELEKKKGMISLGIELKLWPAR